MNQAKPTDMRVLEAQLHWIPVQTRVPLKFGPETLTSVTCARARVVVEGRDGRRAEGWGETPLSVQWVWPGKLAYEPRHAAMKAFCLKIGQALVRHETMGHALTIGHDLIENTLPRLMRESASPSPEPMPYLAGLLCCSVFDQALHDAYGNLLGLPTYETYNSRFMNADLAAYLEPAPDAPFTFAGRWPDEFLTPRVDRLRAWHLVGGLDALEPADLTGQEPRDGHPVHLRQWIERDGLTCLKIKLRGDDAAWDYDRCLRVGRLAAAGGVQWLSADFNCTVHDPAYVNAILDRLRDEEPALYGMILYVEQPFPYDLHAHRIDVRSVAARKPLFMDESAHDWRHIRLGRSLGWSGVALKTCKTQTGALLSLCWAKAHGMPLMVQDLTNPMLAQIPHLLLAAHAGTIMGVETNAMQFYPAASDPEAQVHPGLYRRVGGRVDLSTLQGPGFGHHMDRVRRELDAPAGRWER